jgi:hypothetical protein
VCKYSAQLSSRSFFLPPAPFTPSPSHKLCATRGPSPAYAVTVLTGAGLFYCILLFMVLQLDSITVSKGKCENGNKTRKICKVMTLHEKITILDKLRSGMCAVAVGLTLRWYFILISNSPKIFIILNS